MARSNPIVIIDSEPYVVEMISTILRDEGYAACTSSDRDSTLALLGHVRPALVLLDDTQFNLSADSVRCAIHSRYQVDAPVVRMTTRPDALLGDALVQPQHTILKKPFTIDELLACVAGHGVVPCIA